MGGDRCDQKVAGTDLCTALFMVWAGGSGSDGSVRLMFCFSLFSAFLDLENRILRMIIVYMTLEQAGAVFRLY